MSLIAHEELKKIILGGPGSTETLVKQADLAGERLANAKLSTSQIRALFGEVRQIEAQWQSGLSNGADHGRARSRLLLLKPKMAYRSKKESGAAVGDLVGVLDPAIDLIVTGAERTEETERFRRFVDLFEAILAYHRFHGGK